MRSIINAILILMILAGLSMPLFPQASGDVTISSHAVLAEHPGKDDPPWDPGDEMPGISRDRAIFLAEKKDDPPWDPGDESASVEETRYVHA